jgi:hypothetical protein
MANKINRFSEPGFLTRVSDPDFRPAFRPGFLTRIFDPVFPTRISDFRISDPDFSPGFLTRFFSRISARISHPDFRIPVFQTRISDMHFRPDFSPGFLTTRISGFPTQISHPDF